MGLGVTFATKFDILSKPKVYCSVLDRRRQMRFQIYLILLLCDAGVPEKQGCVDLSPPIFGRQINQITTIRIINDSVPTKILDILASLSDVMNQLNKISISLAGFMATQPTPPSKLVLFSSYESIYNFSRKKKFHIVQ